MESHWLGPDGRDICGLIELSAETGSGTEMLNEIADDYEDELDTVANQIDKILEPITIVLLGVVVGFLVYAIYAPIFSLGDALLPKNGKHIEPRMEPGLGVGRLHRLYSRLGSAAPSP